MPGVFAQTVAFGAIQTGVGLAEDLHKGLIERFRSLPMARSAVLAGRTLADLVRNVFVVLLMLAIGYLVGFRIHTDMLGLIAGHGHDAPVRILAHVDASRSSAFPRATRKPRRPRRSRFSPRCVFASSAFVPVNTMPGWLQAFAKNQPVSIAIDAVRSLVLGGQYSSTGKVLGSLAWSIGIIAVFAPLAVRRYRRAA